MLRSALAAAFLVTITAACNTGPRCSAATCGGCCDAAGLCHGGFESSACGANGFLCVDCGSSLCTAGICQQCRSCSDLNVNCGQVEDGCGHVLECGTCGTGETCGGAGKANVCGPGTCAPKSCTTLDYACGTASDGCSALIDCGMCQSGFCGGAGPHQCGNCQPGTCASLAKNCGMADDGCGGKVDCGSTCANGQTCGGGGVPNVCGSGACVAHTCAEAGASCGSVDDGCGNPLECGTCSGYLTCGGGGTANACGAVCSLGCPNGYTCNAGACGGGSPIGLVLDVKTFAFSGRVTNNGGSPVKTFSTSDDGTVAQVHLDDDAHGYHLSFDAKATSASGPVAFSGTVYPGTYVVSVIGYSYYTVSTLPTGSAAVVVPSLVVTGNLTNQVLDVQTFAYAGSVTNNGGSPVKTFSTSDDGTVAQVHLDDAAHGYHLSFDAKATSASSAVTFSGTVYPGTYVVSVNGYSYYTVSKLPAGSAAVVVPALNVTGNLVGQVLDVQTFTFAGTVTNNGGSPVKTFSTSDDGTVAQVHLDDTAHHYHLQLDARATAASGPVTFSGTLYPGTYVVSVNGYSYYTVSKLPAGSAEVVVPALNVGGDLLNQVLDVQTFTFSGAVTNNGGSPVKTFSTSDDGTVAQVHFDDATHGYHLSWDARATSASSPVSFSGTVYPGTYSVSINGYSYYTVSKLPSGSAEIVSPSLNIGSDLTGQVLDVRTFTIGGGVTNNGGSPVKTFSTSDDGTVAQVHFDDAAHGYHLSYDARATSASSPVTFGGTLYPGTYVVSVNGYSYYTVSKLPAGSAAVVVPSLDVGADITNEVLDVGTFTVSGTVMDNGGSPVKTFSTSDDGTVAQVHLTDAVNGYHLSFDARATSASAPVTFSGTVYAGTYDITVNGYSYYTVSTLPAGSAELVVQRLTVP